MEAAVTAAGVDGNPDTVALTEGRCTTADLSQQLHLGFSTDLVLSFEVAEHIQQGDKEMTFIDNIVRMARRFVVLSWGNQAGHGHVNNRESNYVVSRFKTEGFRLLEKETEELRK